LNFADESMSDFHKCTCPDSGQKIEYPADGMGQTVPCPTCEKSFTLLPDVTIPPAKVLISAATQTSAEQSQNKSEWDEWIALNQRLMERRIKSGIPLSDESTIAGKNISENLAQHSIEISGKSQISKKTESSVLAVSNQKRARSQLAALTEETIRQTTQKGDTPLHRAAMTGRISEIPRHLLSIELFLVRNYSFYGDTPVHAAAKSGQLDKIPKEFLTRETMLASDIYGDGRGRTPTPLERAIEYGHAGKIPKEFLTPEFLSMASRGGGTILHDLAERKQLDVVPEIYTCSPVWNLRNHLGETPHEAYNRVVQRERRELERKSWVPPRFEIPIQTDPLKLLPAFCDESLRLVEIKSSDWTKTYIVNLLDYTCTNPQCIEIHSGVPPRDFGRLCKHIILALRARNLVPQLPPIARGIAENGYPDLAFGVYPGRFTNDRNGNPIYITGRNYDGWINVFALWRRDGVNYYRFGFNVRTKAWNYTDKSGTLRHRLEGERMLDPKPNVDESVLY
jgi:hypothetical protein